MNLELIFNCTCLSLHLHVKFCEEGILEIIDIRAVLPLYSQQRQGIPHIGFYPGICLINVGYWSVYVPSFIVQPPSPPTPFPMIRGIEIARLL